MHWIGVTVLFSGIRRNDENIFLFEGSTMVSKDKNPLSVLLVTEFFTGCSPVQRNREEGFWTFVSGFYIIVYHIPLCI